MLRKTFSGKYKEKRSIDKAKIKKILKKIICLLFFLILIFSLCLGINHFKQIPKTIDQLYQQKNYEKIVELYDNKSDILTNTETEKLQIAKSLSEKGRYSDSIYLYQDVLGKYTVHSIQKTRILRDYVEPIIKSGDYDNAFIVLDEAITWAGADITLLKDLKRIYGFLVASAPTEENLAKGISHLSDYVKMDLDKSDWEANYYLALLLYYAGDYDNAVVYAVNSIKINRNADKAKHLIPKIYFEASNYEKAIEALNALNKVEINNPDNYVLIGKCYEYQRDWYNAVTSYKKVIAIDPVNENAHMGLVRCYTMQHNTMSLTQELYRIKDLPFSEDNKKIINVLLEQVVPKIITSPEQLNIDNLK